MKPEGARTVRAPKGNEKSCRGWTQEAALRMLMNNLDPDVAEKPDELVVYGGRGKAARTWEAFDAIVDTLKTLEDDETLLVQSGKPVGVFRTHDEAPRVLIANAHLAAGLAQPAFLEFPNDPPGFTPARRDFLLAEPTLTDETGTITLSDRPGLGAILNEDVLDDTRVA